MIYDHVFDDLCPCVMHMLIRFLRTFPYTHMKGFDHAVPYTRVDHVFPYDDIGILTEPVQLIFRNDTDAVLCGIRFPKKLPHGDPLRCLGTAFTTTFNFAFVAGAMLF
jgi:hypothetical protein